MSVLPVVAESFSSDTPKSNSSSRNSFTSFNVASQAFNDNNFFQRYEIIKVEA